MWKLQPTIAKDEKLLTLAGSDLAKQRQQVVGNTLRVLAHDSAGVSTARIKVTQQGAVPLVVRLAGFLQVAALGVDVVGNDVLNHGLGSAVGVGRANGAVLGDGDHVGETGCVAVDGGRGGEDNVADIVAGHGAEEGDAAADIDAVVFERDLAGFTDSLLVMQELAHCSEEQRVEIARTLRAAK